eukprot:gene2321-8844_t
MALPQCLQKYLRLDRDADQALIGVGGLTAVANPGAIVVPAPELGGSSTFETAVGCCVVRVPSPRASVAGGPAQLLPAVRNHLQEMFPADKKQALKWIASGAFTNRDFLGTAWHPPLAPVQRFVFAVFGLTCNAHFMGRWVAAAVRYALAAPWILRNAQYVTDAKAPNNRLRARQPEQAEDVTRMDKPIDAILRAAKQLVYDVCPSTVKFEEWVQPGEEYVHERKPDYW